MSSQGWDRPMPRFRISTASMEYGPITALVAELFNLIEAWYPGTNHPTPWDMARMQLNVKVYGVPECAGWYASRWLFLVRQSRRARSHKRCRFSFVRLDFRESEAVLGGSITYFLRILRFTRAYRTNCNRSAELPKRYYAVVGANPPTTCCTSHCAFAATRKFPWERLDSHRQQAAVH